MIGHYCNSGAIAPAYSRTRPSKVRVTQGKDPPVRGHHEIAAVIAGWHHPDYRVIEAVRQPRTGRVEPKTGDRTVERGIAKLKTPPSEASSQYPP